MTADLPRETDAIIQALKASDVEFVVSVPDLTTTHLLATIAKDPDLRLVNVCKEDEGISICAALSCCDRRALLLIQHTGLLDSINSLRATGMENQLPVCMMVGLLGKEPGLRPQESGRYGVRIVMPILEDMGVDCQVIAGPEDWPGIAPAIHAAYEKSRPVALLVGRGAK